MAETRRTAVVTLLPKKGDALEPGNRRPISLLTSDYRIIAKVLQLRLSKVLPNVINEFQTCSVPGRSIHQNLALLRNVVDFAQIRGNPCGIISLDQHKAFDKVNWSFMFKVLTRLNIGPYWRNWVGTLYRDIRCRLLVNGRLSDSVFIHRGSDRGAPCLPHFLLYLLNPSPGTFLRIV